MGLLGSLVGSRSWASTIFGHCVVASNHNPENLIFGRFGLDGCSKSPSCFDFDKLKDLNAHYIKECDKERLFGLVQKLFPEIAAFKDQVWPQTTKTNRIDAFIYSLLVRDCRL